MLEREFALQAINAIHEAFHSLHIGMSSSRNSNNVTAVAVGVLITAVAGIAVAAAVGGTLLYSRRAYLKYRKNDRLTKSHWRDAFEAESGRLIDIDKLLRKIRRGGVDPSIRTEVWPFLFGLYPLESTCEEREVEKVRKREDYEGLRKQCTFMLERVKDESTKETEDGFVEVSASVPFSNNLPGPVMRDRSYSDNKDNSACKVTGRDSNGRPVNERDKAKIHLNSMKAIEEFTTWQRIIRLDAVRMNAEWIPYSPSQANVTREAARELAMAVHLADDGHLEPCRQHHAARLVAILEAYALYDPENGYCQGMSDLLSPFIALLAEDYEAFWCFVYFMDTARHNFRLDEVGIRRQLNIVSRILELADPHLYHFLKEIHAEDCTFVYRMVVVLLRRELSFEQTICLWEVIWADKTAVKLGKVKVSWRKGRRLPAPTDDLLLYVIAASVRLKRKFIMEKCRGMDDILRVCNGMAGHLDVCRLLDDARELVNTFHDKISN
eukprot:c27035_g1_i1 orf=359-1843(-)